MSLRKRSRPTHKHRPTPKGEAQKAWEYAEAYLSELTTANEKDTFVRRLNEFLVRERTVAKFLPNETGHVAGLKTWADKEHENLLRADSRYAYFCTLRTISAHDCIVQPD